MLPRRAKQEQSKRRSFVERCSSFRFLSYLVLSCLFCFCFCSVQRIQGSAGSRMWLPHHRVRSTSPRSVYLLFCCCLRISSLLERAILSSWALPRHVRASMLPAAGNRTRKWVVAVGCGLGRTCGGHLNPRADPGWPGLSWLWCVAVPASSPRTLRITH
eukprot:COSAG06_NODE_4423_length_4281_cov_3.536585_1_plen_159_part_00